MRRALLGLAGLACCGAVPPAVQRMADLQTAIGMCEGRMTEAQLRQVDIWADPSTPVELRDLMARAREGGRRLARTMPPLTGRECTRLIRANMR